MASEIEKKMESPGISIPDLRITIPESYDHDVFAEAARLLGGLFVRCRDIVIKSGMDELSEVFAVEEVTPLLRGKRRCVMKVFFIEGKFGSKISKDKRLDYFFAETINMFESDIFPKIYNTKLSDKFGVVLMEYCEMPDVFDFMSNLPLKKMTLNAWLPFSWNVIKAVAELHGKGSPPRLAYEFACSRSPTDCGGQHPCNSP